MFFEFNNFNSKDNELAIESIPPIAFSNSEINANSISITFAKLNKDNDLIYLKKHLKGVGELILSTMPNCFFKVTNISVLEERKNKTYTVYTCVFEVDGNIYITEGKDIIEIENRELIIFNDYLDSKPTLKVYLNGNGAITINGDIIELNGITGYVIIDCYLEDSYDSTGFANNNVVLTQFPSLVEGENRITISNSIEKVELIPNWRC